MRVLFHVEPLVMHSRPFHYWAWLDRTASMGRLLRTRGWDCRWAMNYALGSRAVAPFDPDERPHTQRGQGLDRDALVLLTQEEIRAIYDAPNVAILAGLQHGTWPAATVERHAELLRARLGAFVPDVIVTYTPSAALRAAWPDALVLHTENGVFSRAPAPPTQYFDPQGLYERSLLATEAATLAARPLSEDDARWLEIFRGKYGARHRDRSPFDPIEAQVRASGQRPVLLPLQFAGEPGFDLNTPFRNQGEYLLHVLEQAPEGVALLACEHPTARWLGDVIDEETRGWLAQACPQLVWIPPDALLHAGQTLVHHVDAVICASSSIGLQALVWKKPLAVVGTSHLAPWATVPSLADLAAPALAAPDVEGAVACMLRHYCVPESKCLADAAWLDAFFRRLHERWTGGVRGLALLEPEAPTEHARAEAA